MSSAFFNATTKAGVFNPYRHGVLMGNFVEDTFGQDLKEMYRCKSHQEKSRRIPLSEAQDKYRWPIYQDNDLKNYGNELTNRNSNAFDFNIDFSNKNKKNKNKLTIDTDSKTMNIDKNIIYPEELFVKTQQQKMGKTATGSQFGNNGLQTDAQNRLGQLHINSIKGILNTREGGINARMLFGHGLDQRKFGQTEFTSTYQLSFGDKIRTETFYNPKFKVTKPFKIQTKTCYDDKDWNFRKFRPYVPFTKGVDRATILQK